MGVLSKCKSTITKLTKADRSCHQYMKERRDEFAQALRDPRNQEQGGSTDFFDLDRQELDLENNYRMKNNEMFAYTITILILVSIFPLIVLKGNYQQGIFLVSRSAACTLFLCIEISSST